MSWKVKKLGELCVIEKGVTGIQKAIPGKYPMVVTSEERKTHNEYQIDAASVIIPLVSSTGHGHRSLKRIHYQEGKFALGSILCAVIPKDSKVLNAKFLYRYLDLNREKELVARMKGMANVTLPIKEIADIDIHIPPIEEQLSFLKGFEETEAQSSKIDIELSKQNQILKQLRQAFLKEAMQGQLFEQNSEDESASDLLKKIKAEKEKLVAARMLKKEKELPSIEDGEFPFVIPKSWVWCRLGEICNNITKGSSPKWQGVNYVDSAAKGILFITSKNVDSFKIDLSNLTYVEAKFNEIEPRSVLKKGDLLTNIVGASIGRTALYDLDYTANINQAVCILRIEHSFINKKFLLYLMNSSFIIQLMHKMQFAPGRANLSMGDLANFPIPLPPLSEQNRIVQKLEQLISKCDELEESIQASQQFNEQLLHQVLLEALQKDKTMNQQKTETVLL